MVELLGLILISFFVTSFLLVPFIDLLFNVKSKKLQTSKSLEEKISKPSDTPIHDLLLKSDAFTPEGGGILIIPVVIALTLVTFFIIQKPITWSMVALIFALVSFGLLGFVDDFRHLYAGMVGKFHGLSPKVIFLFQTIFAIIISLILYYEVGLNNIFIPLVGNIVLGWIYIPMAVLAIVSFSNAYNISDGLDGLSTGLLMICLFAFLVLAHAVFDRNLVIFLGIWVGALVAYLYFNVFPARVYLGDAGAFAFGATLAVIGLLTGKILGLAVIGGVYVVILLSSFVQMFSKRIFKRKVFPVAPLHMYLKYIGWAEPKIVMRLWLAGVMFAIFGLWLALLSK